MATYYCNSGKTYTVSSKQEIIDLYTEWQLEKSILKLVIDTPLPNGRYAVHACMRDSSFLKIGEIDTIVP